MLEMVAISKQFGATQALRGRFAGALSRRDPRPARRERRRQVDPDQDHDRRPPARRAARSASTASRSASPPAGRPAARHRGDLPGADDLPRPLRRREHLHRPPRPRAIVDRRRDEARGRARSSARLDVRLDVGRAGARPDPGRAADGRDRQGDLARRPRPDHGRADRVAVGPRGAPTLPHRREPCATQGVAILFISHRMEEVFEIADRVTVFRDGRWISTTPRAELTPGIGHPPTWSAARCEELFRRERDASPARCGSSVRDLGREAPSRTSASTCAGRGAGLRRAGRRAAHRRRARPVRHRAGGRRRDRARRRGR